MIEDTVLELIAKERKISSEEINMHTSLDELGIDSLGALTLLFEIEDRLEVDIPDEFAKTMETVGDIVDGLKELKNESS